MKNYIVVIIFLFFSSLAFSYSEESEIDEEELFQEATRIVKTFGGTLKPQLGAALKSGGPVHAIEVCSVVAPAIASDLTKKTGWNVRRVSLKSRNKTAIPDSWEVKVLKDFDKRQLAGETAKTMVYSGIIEGKYRFMKAQGVEPVCLKCHASKVSAPIEAALKEKYPNDLARGYLLGQIRGAFSLVKKL